MTEQQIMEQNLAKLMSQHQSLPELCDSEPVDPFQKGLFGKKMKKSKAHSIRAVSQTNNYSSTPYLSADNDSSLQTHHPVRLSQLSSSRRVQDVRLPESDSYQIEIQSLFRKLRAKIDEVQESYKSRCRDIKKEAQEQGQELLDQMIGYLEGSVDFIINDCLKPPVKRAPKKAQRKVEESRGSWSRIEEANKQNRRANNCRKVRGNGASRGKPEEKGTGQAGKTGEKSIYESVLEEREQRRNRKRMI